MPGANGIWSALEEWSTQAIVRPRDSVDPILFILF